MTGDIEEKGEMKSRHNRKNRMEIRRNKQRRCDGRNEEEEDDTRGDISRG